MVQDSVEVYGVGDTVGVHAVAKLAQTSSTGAPLPGSYIVVSPDLSSVRYLPCAFGLRANGLALLRYPCGILVPGFI